MSNDLASPAVSDVSRNLPTSSDVARVAGVSRATVSQVLNGHADRFATETASRVLDAAKQLGYEPSAAGRALRRGTSNVVVALLPHTTFGGNLQDIFERMTETLSEYGYTLMLRMSSATAEPLDRLIAGLKPAAVFAITPFSPEERGVLQRRGILAIDPPSVSQVDYNRSIGQMQAEALIAAGHTLLAFAHLRDERHDPFGFAREEGVKDVAAQHGLDEVAVLHVDIDLDRAVEALRALPEGIAVACYNDDVAMALLSASRILGREVPSELAVIGMDRTDLSRIAVPRLATIEYDLTSAAEAGTLGLLKSLGAGAPVPGPSAAALTLIPGESI